VILIGEMRDAETIDTAMKAAETGHLLVSTVHTPDAQSTVMRILAMFPPEEQDVVRVRLAESLHAVISQRLLPKKDGHGRVVACEVMIVTPTIKELMLDPQRVSEIREYIEKGREQYGMQTFDQHLADLVQSGEVEFEVALSATTHPSDFELKMRTFRRHSTAGRKAIDLPPDATDGAASELSSAETDSHPAVPPAPVDAADATSAIKGLTTGFEF
jgi:twitching motility protein PilT